MPKARPPRHKTWSPVTKRGTSSVEVLKAARDVHKLGFDGSSLDVNEVVCRCTSAGEEKVKGNKPKHVLDVCLQSSNTTLLRHIDTPVQFEGATREILILQDQLENNVQNYGDRHLYYTCDIEQLRNDGIPKGPLTFDQVIWERMHGGEAKSLSERTSSQSRRSYFVYPVLSRGGQTINWLSVAHTVNPFEPNIQDQDETLQDESSQVKSWWELEPENTIIGRAISKRDAAKKRQEELKTNLEYDAVIPLEPVHRIPSKSKRTSDHKSKLLALFLPNLVQLPLTSTLDLDKPEVGTPPLAADSSTKENGLLNDFLKMTTVEKKAFYSSPAMNRITTGRTTPAPPPYSPPRSSSRSMVDERELEVITMEKDLVAVTSCCRYSAERLSSFEEFCTRSRDSEDFIDALDIRLVSEEDELDSRGGHRERSPDVEADVHDMRKRLKRYEDAMKLLPHWVQEICIDTVVPTWFSRKEVELALQRLKAWALVRTEGRVRWLSEIRGRGNEGGTVNVGLDLVKEGFEGQSFVRVCEL